MRISDLMISNNYLGNTNKIKDKISSTIEMFLEKALQLDEAYIKNELKAERIGALT